MGFAFSHNTLKKVGKWTAWLSAGCLALLLTAYAALQTPWAKRLLTDAAVEYCSRELGWKLGVPALEGVLPFTVRAASLRIADKDGEWLAASDIALSIAPWPFGQGLASVRLGAGEVALRRAPVLPPDQGPAAPASRPLAFLDALEPIPVAAQAQVDVARFSLGAALAGQAVSGRASAQVSAMGGAVDARLSAAAQAAPEGSGGGDAPVADAGSAVPPAPTDVTLEARLDPGPRTARLKLTLAEGPGGMVAALAGLGGEAPLSLALDGDGPLSDWRAKLTAHAGQDEMLSGTLTAGLGRTSADDARAGLALSVNPIFLPVSSQVRDALGPRLELTFSGVLRSAGLPEPQWRLLTDELSVAAKALKATLRGDSGPMGRAPRLSFALSAADPGSFGLKAGPLAVEGGLDADIDPAGPVSGVFRLSSPDLGSALSPLGVGLGGKAAIESKFQGNTAKEDFALTLDAGLTDLAALGGDLGPKFAPVLGREVSLRADASLSAGKLATLKELRIATKAVKVQASGSYDMAARSAGARAEVNAADLAALAPLVGMKLAGSVTARTRVEGSVDAPHVTLDVDGTALALDQTRFDRVGLRLVTTPAKGGLNGKLEASAHKGNGKLAASTAFALEGQKLSLTALQASGPGVNLSGNLDASLDHKTGSGKMKASVELSPLGAFLNRKMGGKVQAEVALAASGARQDVSARVNASDVAAEGAVLKKAELTAALTDVLRAPQGDLTLALTKAAAGGAALESLLAKAHGGGKAIDFTVAAKGTLPENFELATGGSFSPAPGGGALRLDKLEASARGLKLALTRPATAAFGPGTMSLDGLNLALGGASITASGALKPGRADFAADVAALPLALLEKAGLPALSGMASAALRVTGTPSSPKVTLEANLNQVAVSGAQGPNITPADVHAEALIAGGRLSADCRVAAGPDAAFELKAALPTKLSLVPFAFAVSRDAPLEASLTGNVDLARVAAMSGDEALLLTGMLKADFTATGRLSAPRISGGATLAGGQADYVTPGPRLRDIALNLEASGTKVSITTFTARDAGQGSISVSGTADLSPDGGFPFEIALVLDKLKPVRMDMATATLSAKVDVTGGAGGAKVKGTVNVGPVEVNIPDRLPPDATPIPVEMAGRPGPGCGPPAWCR